MITESFTHDSSYRTPIDYHEFNLEETTTDILAGEVLFFRENSRKCWLFTNKEYTNIKIHKTLMAEEGSTVLLYEDGTLPEDIGDFPFYCVSIKDCSFPTIKEITSYLKMTHGI